MAENNYNKDLDIVLKTIQVQSGQDALVVNFRSYDGKETKIEVMKISSFNGNAYKVGRMTPEQLYDVARAVKQEQDGTAPQEQAPTQQESGDDTPF